MKNARRAAAAGLKTTQRRRRPPVRRRTALVSRGSTVNLCALDITKAFDRLNHDGLFINLMRRFIPATLLNVPEK